MLRITVTLLFAKPFATQSAYTLLFGKLFFMRIDPKRCISECGSGAFPNPILKTSRNRLRIALLSMRGAKQEFILLHKVPSLCFLASLFLRVHAKGCVSAYGLGAFPSPILKTRMSAFSMSFCQCMAQSRSLLCFAKCLHFAFCQAL